MSDVPSIWIWEKPSGYESSTIHTVRLTVIAPTREDAIEALWAELIGDRSEADYWVVQCVNNLLGQRHGIEFDKDKQAYPPLADIRAVFVSVLRTIEPERIDVMTTGPRVLLEDYGQCC